MAIIAVDMDEVIADALGKIVNTYNLKFGEELSRHDLVGKLLQRVLPQEHFDAIHQFLNAEEFFADLEVMPGAQEVLERLSREHSLFIATAAMEVPSSFTAKYEWLREHFPFISPMNVVFCGDKSILNADYLIDDNAKHFGRFRGQGVLFDAPHNAMIQGYPRVHNWAEVQDYFAREAVCTK
ncbi:MAG: hypothetical protein K2X27_04495 [Candidatus Obscuribacterales bacterium]|nr:hypothetical protein [Candidatus Obscuribacterales bacterium]